jgi:hypothetical protein
LHWSRHRSRLLGLRRLLRNLLAMGSVSGPVDLRLLLSQRRVRILVCAAHYVITLADGVGAARFRRGAANTVPRTRNRSMFCIGSSECAQMLRCLSSRAGPIVEHRKVQIIPRASGRFVRAFISLRLDQPYLKGLRARSGKDWCVPAANVYSGQQEAL